MIITNNSEKQSLYYTLSAQNSVDCGNLAPNEEKVFASYDNKADVKLTLNFGQMKEELSIIIDDAAG